MLTRVHDDSGPLQVERLPDGRRKLLRSLAVNVGPKGRAEIVTVCKGFCMDYSSLPWGLRWLANWDRVDIAGVVHDYRYRKEETFTYRSRWKADLEWFRVARSGGHCANWLQAALGLAGLYLGACWVKPARSKCTWQHKTVMAIVDLLLLASLAWALCEWQLWLSVSSELWRLLMTYCVSRTALVFAVVIAVVAAVNLWQSRGRPLICERDREHPARPSASGDEEK